jgi:guanylate kinase
VLGYCLLLSFLYLCKRMVMPHSDQRLNPLMVLTGPSGVGKGTVLKQLLARHPELNLSISATTRSPRSGEVDGQQYYFLTRSQFETMVAQGQFLEWAEFAGNLYGTPRQPVFDKIAQGERVILEIELEGARQVRISAPDAVQIFIQPPSLAELETRIRKRGQDSEEAIAHRLERAKAEIAAADEFDVQITNEDLETAVLELEAIVFAEMFGGGATDMLSIAPSHL